MNSEIKQQFITQFFQKLREEADYCILRNYETLPQNEGDDIDFLVDYSDEETKRICSNIIINLGWRYVIKYIETGFTSFVCFYVTDTTVDICHLDAYTQLSWRGNSIVSEKKIIATRREYNGYYVTDKGAEIATIVTKAFFGKGIKQKYRNHVVEDISNHINAFRKVMSPIYGEAFINKIEDVCRLKGIDGLDCLKGEARKIISHNKIINYITITFKRIADKIDSIIHPKGKMIVFLGPDGSGKTTLINFEKNYLERFFPHNIITYHRGYEIFPPLKTGLGLSSMKGKISTGKSDLTADKNEKKQRRSLISKLATWAVIIYTTLEFIIGNGVVKRKLRRGTLVLYDRYYYDVFTQPTTRDLIWPFHRLFLGLVRKPDLIIHLIASGEVIFKRKQDLNKDEIDIQNKYMTRLLQNCRNVYDVNTDTRNAEEIASAVFKIAIKHFYGEEC